MKEQWDDAGEEGGEEEDDDDEKKEEDGNEKKASSRQQDTVPSPRVQNVDAFPRELISHNPQIGAALSDSRPNQDADQTSSGIELSAQRVVRAFSPGGIQEVPATATLIFSNKGMGSGTIEVD